MADAHAWLGGRIARHDAAALTGSSRALYAHAREHIAPEAAGVGYTARLDDGDFCSLLNALAIPAPAPLEEEIHAQA